MSRTWRTTSLSTLATLFLIFSVTESSAQTRRDRYQPPEPGIPGDEGRPRWQGHSIALGVNVALGAVTGGVGRVIQGGDFWDGFSIGGLGGGISYLGKYVAAQDFSGSHLLGRQTAALGASINYNAMTGRGALETLSFPIGPVRLHHSPEGRRVTIDLITVGGAIYAASRSGSEFDLKRSLLSSGLVFSAEKIGSTDPNRTVLGRTVGGVVLYRRGYESRPDLQRMIISHEMVHLLQHDYAGISIGSAFEGWLVDKLPDRVAGPLRHFDFGSYTLFKAIPSALGISYEKSLWEHEATFLSDEASSISQHGRVPRPQR